jgi:hypothetical protein
MKAAICETTVVCMEYIVWFDLQPKIGMRHAWLCDRGAVCCFTYGVLYDGCYRALCQLCIQVILMLVATCQLDPSCESCTCPVCGSTYAESAHCLMLVAAISLLYLTYASSPHHEQGH